MNTALIVIDMQNDYLYEKRKKRFTYDAKSLTDRVNAIIHRYREEGCDVIYIRHIIQDLPTNRLMFGYSIAGTEGAELYRGLDIVSDHIYDKMVGDALSSRKLRAFIARKRYDMLHLCGLDACGCVAATALGAAKRGLAVGILREGVATVFDERRAMRTMEKLGRAGVKYI